MKKVLVFAWAVLLAIMPYTAMAESDMLLNGVTDVGPSESKQADGYERCLAHIYSAAGSTAIITVQGGTSTTGPWQTLATITDPTGPDADGNAGEYYGGGCPQWIRLNVTTYAAGTIYGKVERRHGR